MALPLRTKQTIRAEAPEQPEGDDIAVVEPPAPIRPTTRLGEVLVSTGLVTPAQLGEALLQQATSGKRLGALLVELGMLDERALARALARHLDLPHADLRSETPAPEALALLPESVARSVPALPMLVDDGTLIVAVADPLDEAIERVHQAAGCPVALVVASVGDIRRAVDSSYRALAAIDAHVAAFTATADAQRRSDENGVAARAIPAVPADAPVVQIVDLVITQALRDRASDVHLEPQEGRLRVRYRIDGALHDVLALPPEMGPAVVSRIKVMAGMNIVERRRAQDGQVTTEVDGRPLDIRVSTTPTIWGEKAVLRLLDRNRPLYRMEDLGMPGATLEAFDRVVRAPFGMVVCAGPTGSGKTTTLYATLGRLNDAERNVVTIEDPVEYVFPSINQIQINETAGITFSGGLRSILRQDPDVILVGEIRDVETARIAVQAALTGHFVLTSIHATDAASAVHRFLDMGIEPFLLASALRAVVGQRLVRRTCVACREPYEASPEEIAFYIEAGGPRKGDFTRGAGCNLCARTGYQDRVGVYELLVLDDAIRRLVVDRAPHEAVRAAAVAGGMRTLRDEGIQLAADDTTTVAEVLRCLYTL